MKKKRRKAPRTRQQKWPNTDVFEYYNRNPKGLITGDCAFRAISTALDQDYNTTVMEMAQLMCETGYALNDKYGIEEYLKRKGWVKHKQPRRADGTKYTGRQFCEAQQAGEGNDGVIISPRIICNIGGHHIVAVVDGKVYDIWDSTVKCVGNYFTKG